MSKWVWFDMDGTIADLYGVDGWLDSLRGRDTRPYTEAELMYNIGDLLDALIGLKEKGFKIGIISWTSKNSDTDYAERVKRAKIEWLKKYYLDYLLDKVIITAYGTNKCETCKRYGKGILVDDEPQNRKAWNIGDTINATENIIKALQDIL